MRVSSSMILVSALAMVGSLAVGSTRAQAAPCGLDYLPLEEGKQWTYGLIPNPDDPKPGQIRVIKPSKLSIRVVDVERSGDTTTITLEEKLGEQTLETTLSCTKEGLIISPQSFFFAGEPGGGMGMTLEKVERIGTSYPGARGFKGGESWAEKITARVTREAAEGVEAELRAGKVQIERKVRITGRDRATTPLKEFRATRVEIDLSGRAMVEPNLTIGVEMPAGPTATLWFSPGVGLVLAKNRFNDTWQLTATGNEESR